MADRYGAAKTSEMARYEMASPSLLSMEPMEVGSDRLIQQVERSQIWQAYYTYLEARLSSLHNVREDWRSDWAQLAEFILPRRYKWLTSASEKRRRNTSIVDSTGTIAMRTCANGLLSNLCSPQKPWFKLSIGEEEGEELPIEIAQWLESVEKIVYSYLSGSNFYNSAKQVFEDLSTFGTSPMLIYEDPETNINCYVPCAGEYYIDTSSKQIVDTLYRKFVLTTRQLVDKFGLENCPPEIQAQWREKNGSLDSKHIIGHSIEPNFSIRGDEGKKLVNKGFAFREIYWLQGIATPYPLSVRGFYEAPLFVPRWSTTGSDAYGESVSMDVIPDIIQLQVMTKREGEAIDKMVRPPLLASLELKDKPSSILPGHVTYVSNLGQQSGMRPIYQVNPDVAAIDQKIRTVQQRIRVGFFNDLFQMMASMEGVQPRNMMEIQERKSERMSVMGPVVDLWQKEFAGPVIHRCLAIAARRGELPPIDGEALAYFGKRLPWPLPIKFINEFAIMQRGASTATMERVAGVAGNMAAVYPEIRDNINPDRFIHEYSARMTAPSSIMNSSREVAEIRKQRAQQMEEMKQQEMMSQGMSQAPAAAKTLSETQVGGGQNALEMMLGYAGGQGE